MVNSSWLIHELRLILIKFCRGWGHAAVFCMERPHLGPEPQVRWPAVARRLRHTLAGDDSGSNFENYGFYRAQSPDTGRGVHERSWRTNQDVDVKR